jgi:hypothetical protein
LNIHRVDLRNRRDVNRYIEFPFRLYRENPLWVPPFVHEMKAQLSPGHPFFEHSEAAFFLALDGSDVVGRIAVLDNALYNDYHDERTAHFYHFEAVDDRAVSQGLFDAAFDWARARGLRRIWGPRGFTALDGKGLLVEGFQHRPAMGIAYNPPYYDTLLRDAGFENTLELISAYFDREKDVNLRFLRVAEKVKKRRGLRSVNFKSKDELRAIIPKIAALYNETFVEIKGYVPLTEAEAKIVGERIISVADPSLIKMVMKDDEIVGFALAYPDVSAAIQRCRGRLWPFGWAQLAREFKKTEWVNLNGGGILEEYRGLGGDALMYAEFYNVLIDHPQYRYGDMVQVQVTNDRMIKELETIGGEIYKRHRVYERAL